MSREQDRQKILQLRASIETYAREYYIEDSPSISDAVYDSLVRELRFLEEKYPEYKDNNSVIYRVGGAPLEKFEKRTHASKMLSLNDAFSFQEVQAWDARLKKLTTTQYTYFCELKMDGLACSLKYSDGILVEAVTRGDGAIGEDITQNVRTIASVPLVLSGTHKGWVEVRGEIVMSQHTFERLNKKYARLGKPLLANTRNAAAGSVRQLDPRLAAERSLDFFAWDIPGIDERVFQTHSEIHKHLKELGFIVAPYEKVCHTLDEVYECINFIEKERPEIGYGTDGVVVQVDELVLHNVLGVVGKAPRYALAYKYPAEQVATLVTGITVQVGRTGILTPLAHFVPTKVAGSTVSKATLHNIEQIERLDIRVGDTVVIQKAGDVIPEVVEVLKNLRPKGTRLFYMPQVCPECGESVEQRKGATGETTVGFYCTNTACPAKQTRGITHFVHTMEIYEVGPKIVERLQEEGLISDAADLFTLTEADLAGLERFGAKSAENIVREIQSKKMPPLDRFITALGIMHVGAQTARDIALHFGTWKKFWESTQEDLDSIENIGPAVVESILSYRYSHHAKHFIQKLFDAGVQPQQITVQKGGVFEGKIFVLTGTLATLSREDAKKMIQERGGKVASSVSLKTDYVLVGENPGSKLADAGKFNVTIVDEQSFLNMV